MKELFKDYLFQHHILVAEENSEENVAFNTVIGLANIYGIRVNKGARYATEENLKDAARNLGNRVPAPFYRMFPDSVRALTPDQLLFDQLYHYTQTYGMGWFDEPGHSILEEDLEPAEAADDSIRSKFLEKMFPEKCEVKEFIILKKDDAKKELSALLNDLLKSPRPLNEDRMNLLYEGFIDGALQITKESTIPCKRIAIELFYKTKNTVFVHFLSLSDTIKLLEYIQYEQYGSENLKKLNLRNKDRKLIAKFIDAKFNSGVSAANVRECFEKQQIWCGLLHHLHYVAKTDYGRLFVQDIRSGENASVLSAFETRMKISVPFAAAYLVDKKGVGELIRNLNYILSRCKNEDEAKAVINCLEKAKVNPILLVQMMLQYYNYCEDRKRTFKFAKNSRMRVHRETDEEEKKRKSIVPKDIRAAAFNAIQKKLRNTLSGQIETVYIHPKMANMAVPLQLSVNESGYGMLTAGSRMKIPEGRFIRAFTYWEKVNDIDISCFLVNDKGEQMEFSWRNMWHNQGMDIAFSGDETSGYYGGSEYFDIDIDLFRENHPDFRYLIFCDNIYTGSGNVHFKDCEARAGFMIREKMEPGTRGYSSEGKHPEIFDPKTVETSFRLQSDSSFCYMFAIDLEKRQMVWLDIAREGNHAVAGETRMDWLLNYMTITEVCNIYRLFFNMANHVTVDPEKADVLVTDEPDIEKRMKEGAVLIHSWDTEKIFQYLKA